MPPLGLTPLQRYDRNAAIWPQMWIPVRQTSQNPNDPSSARNMTPIKSVTIHPTDRLQPFIHLKLFRDPLLIIA